MTAKFFLHAGSYCSKYCNILLPRDAMLARYIIFRIFVVKGVDP